MMRGQRFSVLFWVGLLAVLLTVTDSAFGQTQTKKRRNMRFPRRTGSAKPVPPPEAPEVIRRDANGFASIRAVRISTPLKIDGVLDETVYEETQSIGGFVQQEPNEGQPATERTESWIFFDDENIYVAARCYDSHPERMVADEMRRDNSNIFNQENFTVVFDTFHDRRNGYYFQVTPIGGARDGLVRNERNANYDWNTIWDWKAKIFDQGYTVEMVIPFKSLRYSPGRQQTWGVNLRRVIQWKNELNFVGPMPAAFLVSGIFKFSWASTLVGLEAPISSRTLEVKPYVISDVRTDPTTNPAVSNDVGADFGFDVKYGISRGVTADFTYNTDFAQVEVDEQQVNLTRFSLQYPEKREFFLEGRDIFAFGDGNLSPVPFFSRRIGLNNALPVPIIAGGRVTGRVGKNTIGLVNIGTDESDEARAVPTNFSVVRYRRDLLRRSGFGFIATNRSPTSLTTGSSQTLGGDAGFVFYRFLDIGGYYAQTRTPGLLDDNVSYNGNFAWRPDRYGFSYEHTVVGEGFLPDVGFLPRSGGFQRNYATVRFSPRPEKIMSVRKLFYEAGFDHIANRDSRLESRSAEASFRVDFESGDGFSVNYANDYEYLAKPFRISSGVTIPVGGYPFQAVTGSYSRGTQHRVSGTASVSGGTFYDGTKTLVSYTGRLVLTPQFLIEPRLSLNFVDLREGSFTTNVLSARTTFSFTPRSFVSALAQYTSSTHTVTTNIRFKWEYRPGSDVFVVYSDGRDTYARGFPALQNRTFVVKATRLFRH